MNDSDMPTKGKRDRSPSYPSISLKTAMERLATLDEHFKRHPAPFAKAGLAWGMKVASSQSSSTLAALKSFGLVEYEGSGADLKVNVSADGRTYLRAQQENIKREVLRRVALKPKAIAKYWAEWGNPRPIDEVCLDELVLKAKFSQPGAQTFLKVYDSTVAYAGLASSDKVKDKDEVAEDSSPHDDGKAAVGDYVQWESDGVLQFEQPKRVRAIQEVDGSGWVFVEGSETGIPMNEVTIEQKGSAGKPSGVTPPTLSEEIRVSPSEREWLRGPLSKETGYRLIVTGKLGPKEIGKLITLLEAQKMVLSDDDEEVRQ
jgi:hypothetical protein